MQFKPPFLHNGICFWFWTLVFSSDYYIAIFNRIFLYPNPFLVSVVLAHDLFPDWYLPGSDEVEPALVCSDPTQIPVAGSYSAGFAGPKSVLWTSSQVVKTMLRVG